MWGKVDPEAVEKAIHLSETRYCSVGAMISKTAELVTSYEINPQPVALPLAEAA